MDTVESPSMTGAFDRSNGFLPIKEIGDLFAALSAVGRALLQSSDQYLRNVKENAPETEREIVRLHLSFLTTCSDVVRGQLQELENAPKVKPGTMAKPVEPEKIIIE